VAVTAFFPAELERSPLTASFHGEYNLSSDAHDDTRCRPCVYSSDGPGGHDPANDSDFGNGQLARPDLASPAVAAGSGIYQPVAEVTVRSAPPSDDERRHKDDDNAFMFGSVFQQMNTAGPPSTRRTRTGVDRRKRVGKHERPPADADSGSTGCMFTSAPRAIQCGRASCAHPAAGIIKPTPVPSKGESNSRLRRGDQRGTLTYPHGLPCIGRLPCGSRGSR